MGKGKEIRLDSPDHFYSRNRPQIQLGFYKLFVKGRGIPIEVLVQCIEEYRTQNQADIHHPWARNFTLDHVSSNFDKFLKIVSEKTDKTFKFNGRKRKGKDGYDEYWQRANLDGTFAYSGCTDDF